MIRATVISRSSKRDDALQFLYNKLSMADWADYKRNGDILLSETRTVAGTVWTAKTVMIKEEDML